MHFSRFLPSCYTGVGLRRPHYNEVIASDSLLAGWWEVHSENFFSDGGLSLEILQKVRERYPVSFHGVGLSLGSAFPLKKNHLQKLQSLVRRFEPFLVSEHLSWSMAGDVFVNDLLPLPLTEESLAVVSSNVAQVQDVLKRQILLENPSTYLQFTDSVIPECEFITEVAKRSGCGILLDVNNIYVSAVNHGYNAVDYLAAIPKETVKEMHLAGHSVQLYYGKPLLIDTHDSAVTEEVWGLYRLALERFGAVPTLIEWDVDIPKLSVLCAEAEKAKKIMDVCKVLS